MPFPKSTALQSGVSILYMAPTLTEVTKELRSQPRWGGRWGLYNVMEGAGTDVMLWRSDMVISVEKEK